MLSYKVLNLSEIFLSIFIMPKEMKIMEIYRNLTSLSLYNGNFQGNNTATTPFLKKFTH